MRTLRQAVISYKDFGFEVRLSKDRPDLPNDDYFAVELVEIFDDGRGEVRFARHYRESEPHSSTGGTAT